MMAVVGCCCCCRCDTTDDDVDVDDDDDEGKETFFFLYILFPHSTHNTQQHSFDSESRVWVFHRSTSLLNRYSQIFSSL